MLFQISFLILYIFICCGGYRRKQKIKSRDRIANVPVITESLIKPIIIKKEAELRKRTSYISANYPLLPPSKPKPQPPLLPHQQHVVKEIGTLSPILKTLVVGLGGLGGHAVTYIRNHSRYGLTTCAIDTNAKDLASNQASFRMLLGKSELHGLGTGIAPDIAEKLARKELPQFDSFIRNHRYEQIIVIAGLGGGTGSGVLPVVLEYAVQRNLPIILCLTIPFNFEGNRKKAIAESLLPVLQASYSDAFVVHQQALLKDYPQAKFSDALESSLFAIGQHMEQHFDKKSPHERGKNMTGNIINNFQQAGTKQCKKCNGIHSLDSFGHTPNGNHRNTCNACMAKNSARHHHNNPEKLKARAVKRKAQEAIIEGSYTDNDILKIRVELRDCCRYCNAQLNGGGEKDHITPISRGGTNWPDNITLACSRCNKDKHAKNEEEFIHWRKERRLPVRQIMG